MPLDALVSLVMTFNLGIMSSGSAASTTGHDELLDVDRRMASRADAHARAEQTRAR